MSFPCISSTCFQRTRTSAWCLLDVAVPPGTPSLSESCSLIVQFFLFDLNLGSTPSTFIASTLIFCLKPLAIGHQLFLRSLESLFKLSQCFLGSYSLLSIALQSFQPHQTLSFQSPLSASRFLWTCAIPPVLGYQCVLGVFLVDLVLDV